MTDREREAAMFHNAGPLFLIAREARDRITADERLPGQRDSTVAVVFSVLAIEAMVTELATLARVVRLPIPPSIQSMEAFLREGEESRGSLGLKMQLFSHALRGFPWDEGSGPYQAFVGLVDLRNALVHTKTDRIYAERVEPPAVLGRLRSLGILADQEPARPWIEVVATKAAARWACKSASTMGKAMIDALPEGHYRDACRIGFWQILEDQR